MKKIGILVAGALFLLSGCGSKFDTQAFLDANLDCRSAQEKVLMAYNGTSASSVEELAQHADKTVKSEDFKAFKETCLAMTDIDVTSAKKELAEPLTTYQTTTKEYLTFIENYYIALSKTTTADEFNDISQKQGEELSAIEDKLSDAIDEINANLN